MTEEQTAPTVWSVVWGNEIHVGDVVKLKGHEGRITRLRREAHRCLYGDHEHSRVGLILELLPDGQQHALWIEDTDPVSVRPNLPEGMPTVPSQEGE